MEAVCGTYAIEGGDRGSKSYYIGNRVSRIAGNSVRSKYSTSIASYKVYTDAQV